MNYNELLEIWDVMVKSSKTKKDFNQMVMGLHSEIAYKCDGWRTVEAMYKGKHFRIVLEKNPGGYYFYNTTDECKSRFILTDDEGERLCKLFYLESLPKLEEI
jgi:hypothetical protein